MYRIWKPDWTVSGVTIVSISYPALIICKGIAWNWIGWVLFSYKMVGFWKIFESGTFNMIRGKKGNLKQLRFGIYISYRSRSALLKGKIRNRNFVQGWLRILNIPKGWIQNHFWNVSTLCLANFDRKLRQLMANFFF